MEASFKRIGLLIRRLFIENRIVLSMFPIFIILAFGFIPLHGDVRFMIYMYGLMLAGIQYSLFSNSQLTMHYLLIPASHVEKIIASFFVCIIYFIVSTLFAFVVGNLFWTYIINQLSGTSNPVSWDFLSAKGMQLIGNNLISNQISIWEIFGITFFIQILVTFMNLGLNKQRVAKVASALLLWIVLMFLGQPNTMDTVFKTINISFLSNKNNYLLAVNCIQSAAIIGSLLLIPLLWTVNYSLLSKKSII